MSYSDNTTVECNYTDEKRYRLILNNDNAHIKSKQVYVFSICLCRRLFFLLQTTLQSKTVLMP